MSVPTKQYFAPAIFCAFCSAICSMPLRADDLADADAAFEADQLERAEGLYSKLADAGSKVARVYRNLGVLFDQAARGRYADRAEAMFRKAIELDGKDGTAHYDLGLHLYHHGNTRDAIDHFREATRLDPKNADARFWLGKLLQGHNLDAPGEAEALYRETIRLDPGHLNAHYFLGGVLQQSGRYGEAVKVYERGSKLKRRDGHKTPDELKELADEITEDMKRNQNGNH